MIHQNLNENKEDEKIIIQNKKDNDSYPKIIDFFYKEEKNQKFNETMEDFILIKHPFLEIENHHLSLFAVFDGHGGEYVSQYLKENFSEFLKKTKYTKCPGIMENKIYSNFERINRKYR